MKKGLIALSVALAMGLATGSVFADNGVHVGVVNVEQIFATSPLVKKQKTDLQGQFKAKQQAYQKAGMDLKAMVDKYNRDKAVMNDKQRKAMETQIGAMQSKVMQMQQAFTQQADDAQSKAMQQFLGKLQAATQKVAQTKHLDMVMPSTGVIYAADTLDITKDVSAAMQ